MSIAVQDAPLALGTGHGGMAARRAVVRWAWRLFRREWRQQSLVLALLLVAVAATTAGLGVAANTSTLQASSFGAADHLVTLSSTGAQVDADVAALRTAFGTAEVIEHQKIPVPGSANAVDLRAQDPHGRYSRPMLRLVSGRYPAGAAEVAMTASVADIFGLKRGDVWTVDGRPRRIVGIVENPKDLGDAFALVAPGQLPAPAQLTLLVGATVSAIEGFRPPSGTVSAIMGGDQTAAKQRRIQALIVLLIATVGLVFIGLLAAAGFTVMAHRRQRALGMMGAIGATDRQVRRVMVANGAAVGAVGALIGTVAGLAAWFAFRPAFESVVGHRIDLLSMPWWAVIAGAVLAVLTAVAASWWPARTAAKLPIVAALSGRPAPPQPAHRFALIGVALAAVGFVVLVLANGTHTVLIVIGILASASGVLLLAPVGIRLVAAAASRAPVAVRLAVRDLARYQARSGAALAAASLAIGIAATIAVSAAAQQVADHPLTGGNLPSNQLIVWLHHNPNSTSGPDVTAAATPGGGKTAAGPSAAEIATARDVAASIAQQLQVRRLVELDVAIDPASEAPAGMPPDARDASLVRPFNDNGQHGFTFVGVPFVATPAVLRFYGIATSDLGPGDGIVTARRDLAGTEFGSGFSRTFHRVPVRVDRRLPNYTAAPNTVISIGQVRTLGLRAEPAGWLVKAAHPLTAAQIRAARLRAAAGGVTIETRTAGDHSLQRLRDYATIIGALLALGVLAMTVGLIRSETANDLRTLTATGASGRTRRTLTAATAAALALLGAILGTAGAYLALVAWHWRHLSYLEHPPYLNLVGLVVGLPVAAVVGGWLFGRAPVSISRRPLE